MSEIWKLSDGEMRALVDDIKAERIDIGDITVVCHTSNQAHFLQKLIDSARRITDKIIILDDCSQDNTVELAKNNGCRVFGIPEGWIYTHGFDGLLKYQQRICESEYHLQLDTGEFLYVPDDARMHDKDYYRTLLIFDKKKGGKLKQFNYNRLFRTKAPITISGCIHGGPIEANMSPALSDIIIFHGYHHESNDSQYFIDRKNRLYFKLLRDGYHKKRLVNKWWYNHFREKKEDYDRIIGELEERIGVLETTDKEIKEIV